MDADDLEPVKKQPEKRNLEVMSVEALSEYIQELEAEIERVKAEMERKKSARSSAEGLFKK